MAREPELTADGNVRINEIQYDPPGSDPADEWIELFNLRDEEIALDGWRLEGGIRFTFPAGSALPAGEYLVVAASRSRLRLAFEGLERVLGDWTGRLDRDGGTLALIDASGEIVDRAAYSPRPPYPALAAGRGSSLERRCPALDGELAANWAAARARGDPTWLRVETVGVATSTVLYVYLSGPGRAHVDDLRITPVIGFGGPTPAPGRALEEAGADWRFTGNHSGSRLSTEKPRSGRTSLLVASTGRGGSSDASAMLPSVPLLRGLECKLSCWVLLEDPSTPLVLRLSGSSPGEGLYAEVKGEARPAASPGRVNSALADSLPPVVHPDVVQTPEKPDRRSRVEIRARIGATRLKSATLHYEVNGQRLSEPMRANAKETASGAPASFHELGYSARLRPFPEGTLVRYWISAEDANGQSARFPAADSPTTALGFFIDPKLRSKLPVYHIFIDPEDLAALNRNPFSDVYHKATFVYDGQVYCDVGFRFRGQTSRRYPKKQLKVKLNRDQVFTTPLAGHPPVRSINLKSAYVDKIYIREALGFDLYRELEEPNCETFFVRLQVNGEYMGLYLQVENADSRYLERNRLDGGWLWKAYATGHGEGQSMGSRAELSRPTRPGGLDEFELKVGDPVKGRELLGEFLNSINRLQGRELETYIREHMDVESFIDFLVGCQLMHNVDHVMKNHLVYADSKGRFTFLAWDLDLTHGRNYECGPGILNDVIRYDMWDPEFRDAELLYGTMVHPKCDHFWNATINAFLGRATAFRKPYYERLAECLGRYYHPDILLPKARRLRDLIREEVELDRRRWGSYGGDRDFDHRYALFENWTRSRYRYLKEKLEALGYEVAAPLNAHFRADDARGRAPRTVRFENLSYGKSLRYDWDFGDGKKSSSRNPRHTYTKPGLYDVTLRVRGRGGEHVTVKRDMVYVAP